MKYFFSYLFVFSWLGVFSQTQILIDGHFEDWEDINSTFVDPIDQNIPFDLLSFQVTNDEDYLYIHLRLNTEIQLMGDLYNHSVFLYIDTDNNSSTGYDAQTGYGTEIGINFKQRFAYYNVTPFSTFELNNIGLIAAPTVTSDEFEIAILRQAIPDNLNPLFPSSTIKITFQETISDDFMPNNGEVFSYEFNDDNFPQFTPLDINKTQDDFLRIMAYNTLFDGFTDPSLQDEYQRILQAIQPNIIGFSECVNSTVSQIKSRLDSWIPSDDPNGWYVIKDDYDLITASIWPFMNSWPELNRQFPTLIDLPSTYSRDLLFTNSHLKCCNGNELRQLQVDQYAAFIKDAKNPGGEFTLDTYTPMVYAGDLNLVGYSSQLNTLLSGEIVNENTYGVGENPDWDNTNISDLTPTHSDANFAYTWKDNSSEYTPSRIDYILYSDAVLDVQKSFVLNTREMTPERLAAYNLQYNDSYLASDHLPVIMDVSMIENVRINESVSLNNVPSPVVYPNPTSSNIYVSTTENKISSIKVLSAQGKEIFSKSNLAAEQAINLEKFAPGIYFLVVNIGGKVYHYRVIKR